MHTSPRILRCIHDLSRDDFRRYPIWENAYGYDGWELGEWYDAAHVDEVTYWPWDGILPYDCSQPRNRASLVAGSFMLADGGIVEGFFDVPTPTARSEAEPLRSLPYIFLPDGSKCGLWSSYRSAFETDRRRLYAGLGRDPAKIFPMCFRAAHGLLSIEYQGVVAGFGYFEDDLRSVVIAR
jgi:hypothetical protein